MSNVVKFPSKTMRLHRMYCDDCSSVLEYWLDDADYAYGICVRCLGVIPETIEYNNESTEEE
jgi:hypothetical protein